MKKVLLVDDETYILELLEKMIDWEFYGFQIIGMAENALEAMQIFHKETPDIIITDICMDNISGIDFITRIRMQNSKVKVLILSAYDKFEYAQKALKLDVDGYLLKPINKEELLNTLLDILKKLDSKIEYQDEIVHLKHSLDSLQKKYVEGQLMDIFKGEFKSLPKEAEYAGYWNVLSIRTIIRNEIVFLEQDLKSYDEVDSFVLFVGNGLFAVFLHCEEHNKKQILLITEMIKKKYCDEENVILCGCGTDRENRLDLMCIRSQDALNQLFYSQDNFYLNLNKDSIYIKEEQEDFNQEKFLLWLINGKTDECIEYFSLYLKECAKYLVDRTEVIAFFQACVQTIKSTIKHKNVQTDLENMIVEAENIMRSHELFLLFLQCMECATQSNLQLSKSGVVIANAQEYIRKECFNEDFSIDILAEHLRISKSYLSKLYKDETMESIWNYVIRIRIAKAKELLIQSNATNFAIAKEIGYSSEYHFSRAFSKIVGVSPSTYKKMYMQITES